MTRCTATMPAVVTGPEDIGHLHACIRPADHELLAGQLHRCDCGEDFKPAVHETIHACPPEGSGTMPCCNRTPLEVPLTDRMTLDPAVVTCPGNVSLHDDTSSPERVTPR